MSVTNTGQQGWIQLPIMDTVEFAAGAALPSKFFMFQDPQSATKGINRTNLLSPGRLDNGQRFLVKSLRLVTGPGVIPLDLVKFQEQFVFSFKVSEMEYLFGGLEFFPAGGGFTGVSSAATTATTTTLQTNIFTNGQPAVMATHNLVGNNAFMIEAGQTFRLEVLGGSQTLTAGASGGTGLFLRAYLDGIRERHGQA